MLGFACAGGTYTGTEDAEYVVELVDSEATPNTFRCVTTHGPEFRYHSCMYSAMISPLHPGLGAFTVAAVGSYAMRTPLIIARHNNAFHPCCFICSWKKNRSGWSSPLPLSATATPVGGLGGEGVTIAWVNTIGHTPVWYLFMLIDGYVFKLLVLLPLLASPCHIWLRLRAGSQPPACVRVHHKFSVDVIKSLHVTLLW